MATWGDRFNRTMTGRQAVPRNQKMGRPRYFAQDTKQPEPSNSEYLRNVNPVPEPEEPEE